MPRLPLHHASGTGVSNNFAKVIRFVRYGCANRPFYHIVVMNPKLDQRAPPIEQLGSYDALTNKFNERLIALNLERIQYWLGHGVEVSKPVAQIFGLAGLLPIHPKTYMEAWRNRRDAKIAAEQAELETAEAAKSTG
ncbi:mitochondrial ribosomal protein S16 [Lasioglossum baleicum]|uniref:mitochondrial ribosomal protein S16 n=1 Tax=Lasioglossum baleicum TaxID=434251 RepID=UPI003FCD6F3C